MRRKKVIPIRREGNRIRVDSKIPETEKIFKIYPTSPILMLRIPDSFEEYRPKRFKAQPRNLRLGLGNLEHRDLRYHQVNLLKNQPT